MSAQQGPRSSRRLRRDRRLPSGIPGRGALGLRGRIVGVIMLTTVATLAVAALALLGPLEQSLRNNTKATLIHELKANRTKDRFARLRLGAIAVSPQEYSRLLAARDQLSQRVGPLLAVVLGNPGPYAPHGQPLLPPNADASIDDTYGDVAAAFRTRHSNYSFGTIDGREYARAAIPFTSADDFLYVLAVRKPIDQVPGAVAVVRQAFSAAALAGLILALMLGVPLSARIVRRLRRLREAALELTHESPAVVVPVDRARDEVGDLARTLATMQARLREQEEARRSFVATASHELRTPLTSLDGMLELLGDDLNDPEPDLDDARALLLRARAQSRRLGRLAADLLDLSRLDARTDLRSEPVELSELSRAVLAEFELGTADRHISVKLDCAGQPVWALGDPGSIARILRILVDNALRVSPPDSELRVELTQGEDVRLSVCDQGPGVAPEEREQIFRRFHRGRDTRGQAGFGLGLAIGRELAGRMGGELVLEDTEPGTGARFTLRLPAAPALSRTLSASPS
ncbi:MAG TPA: HAMP domain-containing sensor histidine kinase [Solirubrobacteraceae bacterium]